MKNQATMAALLAAFIAISAMTAEGAGNK
jgi:hypothetical protein